MTQLLGSSTGQSEPDPRPDPGTSQVEPLPSPSSPTSRATRATPRATHQRHLFGAKRAVSREEWAQIRHACYVEHQKINEIARAHRLRRKVVRAVVCPWPD